MKLRFLRFLSSLLVFQLSAASLNADAMETREWKVSTNEYKRLILNVGSDGLLTDAYMYASELLKKAGVSFPDGAKVVYVPSTGRLIMHNTRANLRKADDFLSSILKHPANGADSSGAIPRH